MKWLKWVEHGRTEMMKWPPIPKYWADLGIGKDGHLWKCSCEYRTQEHKFLVSFDYATEDEEAFLKEEVVYAENYWEAHHRVYHSKYVVYEEIARVIESFEAEHGIEF